MKIFFRIALLMLIFLSTVNAARAAPSQVMGEGVSSCGDFMSQPNMQSVRLEWVLGYISGRNSEAPTSQDRMAGHSIRDAGLPLQWLQNYCKNNPGHPLIVAADKFRIELQQHEPR